MIATRDLIAAALRLTAIAERNTDDRDEWQHSISEVREMCARAMVQPDVSEVKNLVSAACNLMFDAGKLLGRRDAGADREVEDARSARTALLDYVRGILAERDALIADNTRLMQIAAQEVSEAPQPISAAEVPMPEPDAYLYTLEYGETVVNKKVSMQQLNYPFGVCGADYLARNDNGCSYVKQTPLYTTASEAAGYAAGLAAGGKDAERYRFLRSDFSPMGLDIDCNHAWAYRRNATLKGPNLDAAIDAALRGEVKP